MKLPSRLVRSRRWIIPAGLWAVVSFLLLAAAVVGGAQDPAPPKPGAVLPVSIEAGGVKDQATPNSSDLKGEAKKSNLDRTKDDAAELSALADQLRDELKNMNANVLSLDIIRKTEKVEKLARKIKSEANGR